MRHVPSFAVVPIFAFVAAATAGADEPAAAQVTFGDRGFVLRSADGKSSLRVHATVQADGRAYFGDDAHQLADTFVARRVRPIVEATFFDLLDARIMPDFGQGKTVLEDAYVDLHPWKWLRLRGGKFKPPIGLERMQSPADLRLVERGLPTDLVPKRDVGAMLHGDVGGGLVEWSLGVFNGVDDDADTPDVDAHDGKDFAARVLARPLRPTGAAALRDLAVGLAATYGKERGNPGAPALPSYKSPGQIVFFRYREDPLAPGGAALADGERWRVVPQLQWIVYRFGLLAEYARSTQEVARAGSRAGLFAEAWQVQLSAVLTPGDRERAGAIEPRRPLTAHRRGWGAFEVAARYHELRVDDAAFPVFADPARAARRARAFGVGASWWANAFLRLLVSFERTDFRGGAPGGGDRAPENALFGRLQAAF